MRRDVPSFFSSVAALRAFAALFIVFGHSVDQVEGYAWQWVATLGERGVQIFFVISGFSVEWSQAGRPNASILDFTVRRCIRVVPTYWLATLVLALLFLRNGEALSWTGNLLPSLLMIPHASLQQPDRIYPLLIPGWTLCYESLFYLLFGLGMLAGERWRRAITTIATLGIVGLGQWLQPTGPVLATWTSWMMVEFMIGLWLAWALRRYGLPPRWMVAGMALGILAFLQGNETKSPLLELLGLALFMTGMLASEGFRGWTLPGVAWVGAAAYSLYIWHSLAMGSLLKRVVAPLAEAFGLGLVPQALLLWVTSTVVAGAIFVLVDRPMVQWLTFRWARRGAPAGVRGLAASA